MYVDNENIYSEDQAITADAVSTNVVKHGNIGVGRGEKLNLIIEVTEAFNNLTNLIITLQSDTAEAMGSPVAVLAKTILLADLTLGAKFNLGEPEIGSPATEIFSRLNFDVTGTNPTTGALNAFWAKDVGEAKNPVDDGLTAGYPTY